MVAKRRQICARALPPQIGLRVASVAYKSGPVILAQNAQFVVAGLTLSNRHNHLSKTRKTCLSSDTNHPNCLLSGNLRNTSKVLQTLLNGIFGRETPRNIPMRSPRVLSEKPRNRFCVAFVAWAPVPVMSLRSFPAGIFQRFRRSSLAHANASQIRSSVSENPREATLRIPHEHLCFSLNPKLIAEPKTSDASLDIEREKLGNK